MIELLPAVRDSLMKAREIEETSDGRNPCVRTVWQIDRGSDYPRFITAYPAD